MRREDDTVDFSQPGSDGSLPTGVNEWRRGLVYTAKPEIPCPLRCGQEYTITVAFKQKTGASGVFTAYRDLYQRVTALANARISQLKCPREAEPLHTWILCHGWRCLGDPYTIACAFITLGLVCPKKGEPKPKGENAPTVEALTAPGGATLEMLTRFARQRVDEMYNEFDFSDPSGSSTDPVILSYGESVPTCESVNFQPFVQRAEKLARFYYDALETHNRRRMEPFQIFRREWYCVTNPHLTVVHVHFHG